MAVGVPGRSKQGRTRNGKEEVSDSLAILLVDGVLLNFPKTVRDVGPVEFGFAFSLADYL